MRYQEKEISQFNSKIAISKKKGKMLTGLKLSKREEDSRNSHYRNVASRHFTHLSQLRGALTFRTIKYKATLYLSKYAFAQVDRGLVFPLFSFVEDHQSINHNKIRLTNVIVVYFIYLPLLCIVKAISRSNTRGVWTKKIFNTFALSSFVLWEIIDGAALTAKKTTNKTEILKQRRHTLNDRWLVTAYKPGMIPLLTSSSLGPLCDSFLSRAKTQMKHI